MGQTRHQREKVAKARLQCLAALQKYPSGAIATQLARDTGLHPSHIGNVLRHLADEGAIGRGLTRDPEHGNIVTLWYPDPRAGCEKPPPRWRLTPSPSEVRLERQSFNDKALSSDHAEWVNTLKKPRYNPWSRA